MSTRLKLTDSVVLNADNVVQVTSTANAAEVTTTATLLPNGLDFTPVIVIAAGTGKGANLALAMNNALVSNPGGRVLQVPAGDYTVGNVSIQTGA